MAGLVFPQISHSVNFLQSDVFHTSKTARDNNSYEKISMKNLYLSDKVGMPELPVKHVRLIIPADQGVASIIVSEKQDIEISGNYKVLPVQYPVPVKDGELPPFAKPDSAVYASDDLYPREVAQVVHDDFFDGSNHIVTVAVYPIQYKPKSGKLIFHPSINFQLQPGLLIKKNRFTFASEM